MPQRNFEPKAFQSNFIQLDVTSQQSVDDAAAEVERRRHHLDILVNNAGMNGPTGGVFGDDRPGPW